MPARLVTALGLVAASFAAWLPARAHAADPVVDEAVAGPAEGFTLPALVRGGDAFVLRMPLQWGLIAYRPRVRIELAWAHQLGARGRRGPQAHWLSFGLSALLDRGRRHVLAPDLYDAKEACAGSCRAATVAGANLAVGYRFAPVFERKPWLAPVLNAAVVSGAWAYPARVESSRTFTAQVGLEAGAGLRIFLTERIAVGADLDVQLDALIHGDRDARSGAEFGLGLGIFPLVFELRR